MLVCLNDPRNRIRVPLSLDLSSEIDRITSRQAKSERFSLELRAGGYNIYNAAPPKTVPTGDSFKSLPEGF